MVGLVLALIVWLALFLISRLIKEIPGKIMFRICGTVFFLVMILAWIMIYFKGITPAA